MHVDVVLPGEHERQGSFEVVRWSETAILGGAPAVSGGAPQVGTFSEQVWGLSAERRQGGGGAMGGMAGAKVGATIDLATAGATLGLGTLLGGVIGAIGGVMAGGQMAAHLKLAPLRDSQDRLRDVLADYDAALAREQDVSVANLPKAFDGASATFDQRRTAFHSAYAGLLTELTDQYRRDVRPDVGQVRSLLLRAQVGVEGAVSQYAEAIRAGGSFQRNRVAKVAAAELAAKEWRTLARQAAEASSRTDASLSRFFDVLLASPDGETLAQEYLAGLRDARSRMRRQAVEGNRYMVDGILQARAESVSALDKQQDDELARARAALEPHIVDVTAANDLVTKELANAGA